ncbi:MAG: FHA domain-containing protein [Myxococcota bacterium]|nr:FHA domain-containing protein [Myxococcota bacterium]
MGVRLSVRPRERGDGDDAQEDALYELDQERILIGRGAGADVRLPHASVSTRHATIEQRGGRYVIVDHGAVNGTHVQGARIVPDRPKPLRDGDRISIGAFELAWKEGVAVSSSPTAERTASLARRLLRDVLGPGAPEGPRVVVLNGPDEGRTFAIPAPPATIVIGRGDTCDLPLADADASREHVDLVVDLDGVIARDRGSKNGLLVNDRRVPERRLVDRDELLIGSTLIVFEDPVESALRAAEQAPDEALPAPAPPPLTPSDVAAASADDPDAPTGEPEPSASTSPARSLAPGEAKPGGARLGSAELLIYALAAIVFLASIAGLVLLLRGE